jgi:hypothetical protein
MPEGMQMPEGMTREDMMAMRDGALAQQGGGMMAQLGVDGAEMVPVTIGATTDTDVQITSGVAAGDVLIVPDASGQSEGQEGDFKMPIMGGGMMRGPH